MSSAKESKLYFPQLEDPKIQPKKIFYFRSILTKYHDYHRIVDLLFYFSVTMLDLQVLKMENDGATKNVDLVKEHILRFKKIR